MAPLPPDPYKALGVAKDAQTPEIRSCYRKLVLKCHPDKFQDPKLKEEKQAEFQRVQQAYELLSNDDERQKYDDKARLEELRRLMKEKAHISSPKSSAKYSAEFEIRTETRPSFKSSPSTNKVYAATRHDDDYGSHGPRFYEKSSRSSKRDPSVSERYSKREAEKERDKERDRERRRKEEDVIRRKAEKEQQKLEKKQKEKLRDREIKRDAEEKYRTRHPKPTVEVYEDEAPRSDRKRSSKKDDKAGRTSPRDDKPTPSRPPLSRSFYSPDDRSKFDMANAYLQAARGPPGPARSHSYSARPVYPPAAPSPPPSNPKKAFVVEESDSDEYVRRSAAASRRGSGDGPRASRERSAYRKSSNEVLDDNVRAVPSPAARHTASFSRGTPLGSSPPRHDMPLPRVNSMPQQPNFARPGPGITRAHTFATVDMPRGRDRSRAQPQAHIESSDSEDDRRYRSRRTASPEALPRDVFRYVEPEGSRRSHRSTKDADTGHAHYLHGGQPVRVSESRIPPNYRDPGYAMPPSNRYHNVATSKYDNVSYSEYHSPYHSAVRA